MKKDDFNKVISKYIMEENASRSLKNKDVYNVLRFAISGNPVGPPIGEVVQVLGKETVFRRLNTALDTLF